jgi:hypothetical protein
MFTNSYFDSGRYTTINILFRTVGPKEENRMSCDAMRACRRAYGRAGGLWVGSWWMDGRGWYAGGGVRGRVVDLVDANAAVFLLGTWVGAPGPATRANQHTKHPAALK